MTRSWLALVSSALLIASACGSTTEPADSSVITEVASGLLAPIGLAETADGRILVAEDGTGQGDFSGAISVIENGAGRVLVSGFPSGRDSGDLSGSAMVGVDADDTVFIGNFGEGHIWSIAVDELLAVSTPLTPDELTPAMAPLNAVQVTNPFDVAFAPDGRPVVSDSSANGLAIETADGQTEFFHRFGQLDDPNSPMKVDAVPTGIERVGDEYFVTLTGGCPYPDAVGLLVAVKQDRSQRTVADGLFMPIDVTVGPDGTMWVLEFADFDDDASCFTGEGYREGTGRLSRLTEDGLEVVVDNLDNPGAVLAAKDGTLYVSEVFSGRVIAIEFVDPAAQTNNSQESSTSRKLVDIAADVGIDFQHGAFRQQVTMDPVAQMGGGVCWLDYDNDGWMDLFFVNSYALDETDYWQANGGLPTSQMYRNEQGSFSPVTVGAELAIRGNGCLATDLNADGWTDIYVTADGPNQLLVNRGGQGFDEVGAVSGVDADDWNSAAVAGDLTGDGIVDLFVASYVDLAIKVEQPTGHFPQDHPGVTDHFYVGTGAGADGVPMFSDQAELVGLTRSDRGLGAVFSDIDGDGDLDLYVANDGNPNRLYLTEPSGQPGRVRVCGRHGRSRRWATRGAAWAWPRVTTTSMGFPTCSLLIGRPNSTRSIAVFPPRTRCRSSCTPRIASAWRDWEMVKQAGAPRGSTLTWTPTSTWSSSTATFP